jgi:starch synthase
MRSAALRLLYVASECQPFAKAGGLADAVSALAKTLGRRGHDARVLLPLYGWIDPDALGARALGPLRVPMGDGDRHGALWSLRLDGGGRVYLLEHDEFFKRDAVYGTGDGAAGDIWRFAFLSRAALQLALEGEFIPDVLHAHDWPTALSVAYLDALRAAEPALRPCASVLTIHNLEYQGRFSADAWRYVGLPHERFRAEEFEDHGGINLLKGGIAAADAITTVSPTHAREMQCPGGGHGLEPFLAQRRRAITGILNGVDEEVWDPRVDRLLPCPFEVGDLRGKLACKRALQADFALEQRDAVPLLAIVSRFAAHKGLDLLRRPLQAALDAGDAQLVVQGSGDAPLDGFFADLARRLPGRVGVRTGYSEETAHRIHGGADFFLMPSRYEPCGLGQMYAMRYGTLPIVRATGGLADTVTPYDETSSEGTGFVFAAATEEAFGAVLRRALDTWYLRPAQIARLRRHAMARRFSWDDAATRLETVYGIALEGRARSTDGAYGVRGALHGVGGTP